jgi:hypothetical protein
MPTDPPPPRRNKHLARWFLVLALAVFGWSGWQAYAYRSALSQAKALGWKVQYTDPVETIRKNWKAAFKKETWLDGVTDVIIPTGEAFEQHLATFHRLNPKELLIDNAATLRDLSALQPCTRLRSLWLYGCKGLTNVDTLKNLSALQSVSLDGCTGLTNVDGLKNLTALQMVWLADCTGLANVDGLKNLSALKAIWLFMCKGLTKESVAELKAALPNAKIYGP